MSKLIKDNYFVIFAIISGFPLFFIPNVWDAVMFDYAFKTENLLGVEHFYKEIGSPFQLFFIYIIFFIQKITFLSHEFLFDFFTILILILFSFEIKKYSENVFGFDKLTSNFCAIIAITFPTWHTLVAFNLGLYLTCYYLALLGYRFFVSKNLIIKIIGIIVILLSFSQKSNFAFIIGLCLAHNLRLFFNDQIIRKYSLLLIILLSFSSYLIDSIFFAPYGIIFDEYNKVKFENLNLTEAIKNIYNYLTFFIYYLWVPIFYYLILKFKNDKIIIKNLFKRKNIGDYIAVGVLFGASILPYILVNKSSDVHFFSDYDGRHSYLVAISFSLFFPLLLKQVNDSFNIKKVSLFFVSIFILQNLLILGVGYYTKVESAIFRYDFAQKLKEIKMPEAGNVKIVNKHIPGSLRHYEISYIFYKAYGKAAWWVTSRTDQNERPPEWMLKRDGYKILYFLKDYSAKCNTVIKLTNEIDKYQRISKLYIINYKDYFKIESSKSTCVK